MARLTNLLLLGAVGASAHPARHGHQQFHQRDQQIQHAERAADDVIFAVIDGETVSWTQSASYPSATPTTVPTSASSSAAAVATGGSSSSSSSSSGLGIDQYISFADYCSPNSDEKRATKEEIAYVGNTGSTSDYGCNLIQVATETVAKQYNNTIKFYGATEDQTCLIWNKIGSDGAIDGFFKNEGAKSFKLASGAVQYWVAEANSQGGAACWPASSGVETTSYGEFAGTWLEFDFENSSNNNWSGADASCIVAQAAGLTVYGLQVCTEDESTCSTIASGASTVTNAFTEALKDADGLGINQAGPLNLVVNVGY